MKLIQRTVLTALAAAAFPLLGAAGLPTLPLHIAAAQSTHSRMDTLKEFITDTGGTVWGSTTATYKSQHKTIQRSCSASQCHFRIPHGVKVHLTQVPTNSSTWPFSSWQVKSSKGTRTLMSSSINVKMSGNLTITAVYVLSSGNGYHYKAPPLER